MARRQARVIAVAFDGVQSLDVTGPCEVFAEAGYAIVCASTRGGAVRCNSGLSLDTVALVTITPRADDLVLVAGGEEPAIRAAVLDRALADWLRRAAPVVHRVTSVCSGAFLLAGAGLLDGKRAATHWEACDKLAQLFPRIAVDPHAIFVRDGQTWTSAGVTTGIDMALAIVEEDRGRDVADAIARRLVLYVRRPGYQSQFSDALVAQQEVSASLAPAIAWARGNLGRADVPALARRAALSVRSLHRRCLAELGTTPAKLVDKLRVEHARTLLATTRLPAKTLAARSGFGTAARMRRAFERELGMSPAAYRSLHGTV
jgi:transcriptional regulator GlxA family with amidase domain